METQAADLPASLRLSARPSAVRPGSQPLTGWRVRAAIIVAVPDRKRRHLPFLPSPSAVGAC